MVKDILSYGVGTLVAFGLIGALAFLFIRASRRTRRSATHTSTPS